MTMKITKTTKKLIFGKTISDERSRDFWCLKEKGSTYDLMCFGRGWNGTGFEFKKD